MVKLIFGHINEDFGHIDSFFFTDGHRDVNGSLIIFNASQSTRCKITYEDADTPLTKEQWDDIFTDKVDLACMDDKSVLDCLCGSEYDMWVEKTLASEKEFIMSRFDIDDDEIDDVIDWLGDYPVSSSIICSYETYEKVAIEFMENFGVDDFIFCYIDYSRMGEDLVKDGDRYYELGNGSILEKF